MQHRIVVASGKGGVGKSTLSACLAQEMARRGHSVLLIDCDIGLRSLDLILGVDEHVLFTWADVVLGRCELHQAIMLRGDFHLLCAPLQPERALKDDMLQKLVKSCTQYDVVIVDAPAGIGFGFRMACLAANRAVVVTLADPICVRAVSAAVRQLRQHGVQDARLAVNRFDRKLALRGQLLMIDDIIDQTETQLIGVVPQESRLFAQTADGMPLQEGIALQAVRRIAGRLDGENIPLVIDAAE
ncbi:MAG: P-loop NTPase [Oscillospiraceae bacterium]|jgi:septum site-determining protein MinD|nr:P-loop NTPase [Oscillospiraceae bacterium]